MNFENCNLFKLNRKRDLKRILGVKNLDLISFLRIQYKIRIQNGKRLIEEPCKELKVIQRRLLRQLYDIEFDDYIFSGVPGKSAYDNALYHVEADEILKLDMQKFFPNTSREKVYCFFKNIMKMSPDLADICTDITTIDYSLVPISSEVEAFLRRNNIKYRNHLPSGTPTSQLLSYLANLKMFDEMYEYANDNNIRLSIYVDDVAFSIKGFHFKDKNLGSITKIIRKNGYRVSKEKTKRYIGSQFKKVTGFVISPEKQLVIPNKIRMKIKRRIGSKKEADKRQKESIKGLIKFAQMSDSHGYKKLLSQL